MSSAATGDDVDEICASCGITGGDNIKLKNCTACKLVKYCCVECQRNHRSQHKRACKKRAAELKDELLFKQPESTHLGDCPICLLPIPIATTQDDLKFTKMSCCSKLICDGCEHANDLREEEAGLPMRCIFCRQPIPETDEEIELNEKKRAEANDPLALYQVGGHRFNRGDSATAIEYWEKAAEMGEIGAHYSLSRVYGEGRGAEMDRNKFVYHLEQAAIGGHPIARDSLGEWEEAKGNIDKAVKHYIIAANLGYDASIERLKNSYVEGVINKEDFAAALRTHQAAVDAMKSPQRDDAAEAASLLRLELETQGCV